MRIIAVYDKKANCASLATVMPNKDVFIRQLLSADQDMVYSHFPEDYFVLEFSDDCRSVISETPFTDFIKKESVSNAEKG